MSKVTLKNDILPTFKPIGQRRQKRKIVDISSDNGTDCPDERLDQVQTNKRSKAKNDLGLTTTYTTSSTTESIPVLSNAIAKSAVWIAAALLMQEENEEKQITKDTEDKQPALNDNVAAFSVYHGLEDSRNITEKVILEKDQDLTDVYVMGIIRILEQYKNDPGELVIHTGCASLHESLVKAAEMTSDSIGKIINQIQDKIAERSGNTSFTKSGTEENEFKVALRLAEEKLLEKKTGIDAHKKSKIEDASPNDEQADKAEKRINEKTDDTSKEADKEQQEAHGTTGVTEDSLERAEEVTATAPQTKEDAEEKDTASVSSLSWGSGLSLKSFFDLFKPFSRSKKE